MANDLVEVFYLEMFEPQVGVSLPPRYHLAAVHVENPTVPYYRALFDAVDAEFHCYSRKEMSDQALAAIIGDPKNELHVLQADGVATGFVEIDRRRPEDVELAFFDLIRSFIGKGPSKWFLQWAVADRADFSLFFCRSPTGLVRKQLLTPDYQPHYRQWPWYRDVRESSSGRWSPP